ncbi:MULTISPECIES: hypothetical protein [Colwellia]|uniref:Uncharacterized protein n=1 Tax=Colwellia marinimaniae TaxID=1513592 RepID=A0ABQ0MTP2_9GAMM|nr:MULTISPECIES: hypothetical protein [Colwellia]GAW95725.1 hypothetical protein MTCD1_01328 [Colwellia marinimaniae]
MLNIIIPDPGLREYGGHHPAMINAIANTQAVIKGDMHLEVYCNKACANDFITATQTKQVTIKKHFTTDFYQYFYQSPSLATLNGYINQLSKEYLTVFEQHASSEEQGKVSEKNNKTLFLYHTLNWEHAIALGSAIAIYNKRHNTPLHHCVFLMFNPIKYNEKGELNNQHFLNFKLGFSLLAKQKFVQYYAAEEELQQSYHYLFTGKNFTDNHFTGETNHQQNNKVIPIHPCGLLSQYNNKVKKVKRVILFTGDAKVNKGFLTLPDLVGKIIQEITDSDVEFVIQYTITNDGAALKQTDNSLQLLAKADSRIKLTTRFWSHSELHENFAKANSILFNYDSLIYKNQSSGILWLAASYHLNMVFLTSNWLMREADKLDCHYSYCSKNVFSQKTYKYLMQNSNVFDKVSGNNYRKQLFQDIGGWLLKTSMNIRS